LDYVIETGCYDGKNSFTFLRSASINTIHAFEPDHKARKEAKKLLAHEIPGRVKLFPFGLSDVNQRTYLDFSDGSVGFGQTRLVSEGTDAIEVVKLDDCVDNLTQTGLLWLDVEGQAVPALIGGTQTLKSILIAKIEVQTHNVGPGRKADFLNVIQIMKNPGLIPPYAPLHPWYFGDIIFARRSRISLFRKFQSVFLVFQLNVLHLIIYPMLGKVKAITYSSSSIRSLNSLI